MQANVTLEQIRLMKHAIGYAHKKVKRGKYIAWRNYFCSYKTVEEWDGLVDCGLATKEIRGINTFYFVTDKGLDLLAGILEIKIVEDD